ncbi:site-specific DNA-methyltransferase [Methylocystis sp. 9N]|uniref:Methyltransferase n=1 Tax=Methylocystis borbori TaxID=3118750 RepID=A0ABU7XFR8_9HYPH
MTAKVIRLQRSEERKGKVEHIINLLKEYSPSYQTKLGAAYCYDSRRIMSSLPDECVDLVITSPPYALEFQKEYGNKSKDQYVNWFLTFAEQIKRILKPGGSFVLNIGGSYQPGSPTRSLYHFKLLIALCEELNFHLAQECFWYNPAKLPAPAEWVNVRRMRVKDSIEYIWWLSSTPWPKADNRNVLTPYSDDMLRLISKGYKAKQRPSGHNITHKFQKNLGGSIPSNLVIRGNNESNSEYIKNSKLLGQKVHPARFPAQIPEFFIKLLTEESDIVLDPFAGSNTTGAVSESLNRKWISVEIDPLYTSNSALRFGRRI